MVPKIMHKKIWEHYFAKFIKAIIYDKTGGKMKINNNSSKFLHMNRNEIISLLLAIFLIFLSIGSSGCLVQNKPGQSPTNIPVTNTVNNSLVPSSNAPTPIPTLLDPSRQSGVRIFKSAESICNGDVLTFGLINEGNSTIIFGGGDPFWIQFDYNGTWGDIFDGGGTQGFWRLTPGNKTGRKWKFSDDGGWATLYEFYNKSGPLQEFTIRPGLYRIIFLGRDYETNEHFNISTEFTIKDCQSGPSG